MIIKRREFVWGAGALSGALALGSGMSHGAVEVNDDGLHVQPWFMETFLDLREDHGEAAGEGKRLAILFEQKGCPYCKELHEVNLAKPKITDYVKSKFGIVQLNIWGARGVTDFDGEEMEERAFARKLKVNFTPTIVFFDEVAGDGAASALEVARMPGYFKPFHFLSMFEFVEQKAYAEMNFQRFLQDKFQKLEEQGIKPDVW